MHCTSFVGLYPLSQADLTGVHHEPFVRPTHDSNTAAAKQGDCQLPPTPNLLHKSPAAGRHLPTAGTHIMYKESDRKNTHTDSCRTYTAPTIHASCLPHMTALCCTGPTQG